MSATLLLGIAGIGAAALFAMEKKDGHHHPPPPDASPMTYPDNTNMDGALDQIAAIATPVGSPGPIDEPETPATGTGAKASTFGPTGVLSTGGPTPPPTTTYHKIVPIVQYAYGVSSMGRTATSAAYATVGTKIGAIW